MESRPLQWVALAVLLVILGSAPLARRAAFDAQNRGVDICVDGPAWRNLAGVEGQTPATLFPALARAGATAVAIPPLSLRDLHSLGRLELTTAHDRLHLRMSPEEAALLIPRLERFFPVLASGPGTFTIRSGGVALEQEPLFPDVAMLDQARRNGLTIVPRLPNPSWLGTAALDEAVSQAPYGSAVVFGARDATGYPHHLDQVARALAAGNLSIGRVEFSGQRGTDLLIRRGGLTSFVVHSIPPRELAVLPHHRLLPRWRRALTERSVRFLYVHPLPLSRPPPGRGSLVARNLAYLGEVVQAARDAGLEPGKPRQDPKLYLDAPPWPHIRSLSEIPLRTAASLLLAVLIARFALFPPFLSLTVALLVLVPPPFPARLVALAGALSAASLSVLFFADRTRGKVSRPWPLLRELGLFFLMNVLGGALVGGLLSGPEYLLRLQSFRGVKLLYLGVPALALLRVLQRERISLHARPVRYLDLVLLCIVATGALVYVSRSGNFSVLPPSHYELAARDWLETVLPQRPRTKEVLVGYPCLLLLAFLGSRADWRARAFLTAGGAVAAVSITNAFCHFASPFGTTILRGLVGLAGGVFLLMLIWPLRRGLRLICGGPYVTLTGYFGEGNVGDDLIHEALIEASVPLARKAGCRVLVLTTGARSKKVQPQDDSIVLADRWSFLEMAAAMAGSRALVVGGGGLFQDRTGPWTVPYYLAAPLLARLMGVHPCAWVGQSFGSLRRPLYRRMVAWFAGRASLVQARDLDSVKCLKQWGAGLAHPPDVELGTDLAFWRGTSGWTAQVDPPPASRVVGLALRPPGEGAPVVLAETIRQLRTTARERGLSLRFLIFHPGGGDRELVQGLSSEAEGDEIRETTVETLSQDLAGVAALVSMRYHAMLVAALHGVPVLGLSYDRKTDTLLRDVGLPHAFMASDVPSPEELSGALTALLNDPGQTVAAQDVYVGEQFEVGRKARERYEGWLEEALGRAL